MYQFSKVLVFGFVLNAFSVLPHGYAQTDGVRVIESCRGGDPFVADSGYVLSVEKNPDGTYVARIYENTILGIQPAQEETVTREVLDHSVEFIGQSIRFSIEMVAQLETADRLGELNSDALGTIQIRCQGTGRLANRKVK